MPRARSVRACHMHVTCTVSMHRRLSLVLGADDDLPRFHGTRITATWARPIVRSIPLRPIGAIVGRQGMLQVVGWCFGKSLACYMQPVVSYRSNSDNCIGIGMQQRPRL
eukprot:10589297-Lingulodinium_polyedra.AAC.1